MDSSNDNIGCGCGSHQACPACVSRLNPVVVLQAADIHPLTPNGTSVSELRQVLDTIEAESREQDAPQPALFRRGDAADRAVQAYSESLDGNPDGNTAEVRPHSHYFKPCPFPTVDVYRVLQLFDVTDPCVQHAVKKLLCTGNRGHKSTEKDVQEAIDSLKRWQEMRNEELQ